MSLRAYLFQKMQAGTFAARVPLAINGLLNLPVLEYTFYIYCGPQNFASWSKYPASPSLTTSDVSVSSEDLLIAGFLLKNFLVFHPNKDLLCTVLYVNWDSKIHSSIIKFFDLPFLDTIFDPQMMFDT